MSTALPHCSRPWNSLHIDAIGNIKPCPWGKISCGSTKESSPSRIWYGPGFELYRVSLTTGNTDISCASHCPTLMNTSVQLVPEAVAQPELHLPIFNQILVFVNEPVTEAPRDTLDGSGDLIKLLDQFSLERSRRSFCIALGCYIRPGNFRDCLRTLDLCEEYSATSEFFLFRDDLERPPSFSRAQSKACEAVLDRLDKELWSRGSSRAPLVPALSQFRYVVEQLDLTNIIWPQLVYIDSSKASIDALWRGVARSKSSRRQFRIGLPSEDSKRDHLSRMLASCHAEVNTIRTFGVDSEYMTSIPNEVELQLAENVDLPQIRRIVEEVCSTLLRHSVGARHLTFTATQSLRTHWKAVAHGLDSAQIDRCSLDIPFWVNGQATSALEWIDVVSAVRELCEARGWVFEGGRPDLLSLGLDISNQYPEVVDVCCRQNHASPRFTVLAPVYNRESELSWFLESLAKSSVKVPFEILLIDDGSTDASWNILTGYCRGLVPSIDYRLVRLRRENPYVPNTFTFRTGSARQAGLQFARGERIVFFDPDQVIDTGCLAEHLYWGELGYDVVLGVRSYPGENLVHRTRMRMRHVAPLSSYKHWWGWFFTGNVSVSQRALECAGGFDETLQFWGLDDMDLGYRLEKTGARFWHTPRARVTHLPGVVSGGGLLRNERAKSCRFQMEVLYRKYLDAEILATYSRFWSAGVADAELIS